jgi:glycosyltransferase involved in cell wall biosynthesis
MVIISHPTGNQNVRQAVTALERVGLLDRFHTAAFWDMDWKINRFLPPAILAELGRRAYPEISKSKIHALTPIREATRLISGRSGFTKLISPIQMGNALDRATARVIRKKKPLLLYGYEGVALSSFREAKRQGITCVYELPSGYWHYETELLREEAELMPEYAATIAKLNDPREHVESKDEELRLADFIVVPSAHVVRTLGRLSLEKSKVRVVPYGSDQSDAPIRSLKSSRTRKLRALFVGGLVQRKGIGYVLNAVRQFGNNIELTMIGRQTGECNAIAEAVKNHRWLPSVSHRTVLEEMSTHDVLLLPSLSEGFGLCISEALSRGLPVITTRNSGGEEMIRDGEEGFFVPIRSADAIVQKLDILDRDRSLLDEMSSRAVQRAREFSWQRYHNLLTSTLKDILTASEEKCKLASAQQA